MQQHGNNTATALARGASADEQEVLVGAGGEVKGSGESDGANYNNVATTLQQHCNNTDMCSEELADKECQSVEVSGGATYCNTQTLQHDATHCNSTATRCNTLQHKECQCGGERGCNILQHTNTATLCNTLQHTATRCNTLQHDATQGLLECGNEWECNILHHTNAARHRNTLQHAATHCNTRNVRE